MVKMKLFTIAILALSINAYAQFTTGNLVISSSGSTVNSTVLASPAALPDNVCSGQSVQLCAIQGGGLTNYTCTWTSDPPGFFSDSPNPLVKPLVTTNYRVEINDGINISSGNVTVNVKELPRINLIPVSNPEIRIINEEEISVCPFQSITIDAGNPGSNYLWSNGSEEQTINVETSGIAVDLQEFEVTVTDPLTGCFNSANISVWFTFNDCTYGTSEINQGALMNIYPNPSSDGYFSYIFQKVRDEIKLEVYTSQGIMIKSEVIPCSNDNIIKSTLDLSNQTPGVYLLKALNNKTVMQQKLIIQ